MSPHRSFLVAIAAVVATTTVIAACGVDDPGQEVRAHNARASAQASTLPGTTLALNTFGLDLYRELGSRTPGNVAVAPVDLARSLAMARSGAAGATRAELDQVLHADRSPDLDVGLATIEDVLRSRGGERRTATRKGTVAFDRGATIWVPRGTRLKDEYLGRLASDFDTGARVVDFRSDPDTARRTVNDWAGTATRGAVTELVPRGLVSEYTVMLLASAFSLRAPWLEPFSHTQTSAAPFRLLDGTTVNTPMMASAGAPTLRFARSDAWQAVELPYLGEELSMVLVLPEVDGFATFDRSLSAEQLREIVGRLQPTSVALRLPRFQFTSELRADDALRALGLTTGMADGGADFSGITGDEPLVISATIQQTYAAAGEYGTGEQKGAITVQNPAGPTAPPAVMLTLDRPFVFAVVDRATGLVLDVGRVVNPLA